MAISSFFFIMAGVIISLMVMMVIYSIANYRIRMELEDQLKQAKDALEKIGMEKSALDAQFRAVANQHESDRELLSAKENTLISLTAKVSALEATHIHLTRQMEEKEQELNSLNERLRVEFRHLVYDVFEEKSRIFTEQSLSGMNGVLNPLKEKIIEFQRRIEETQEKASQERFVLQTNIKNLADLNRKIGQEAENLTKALKYESKTRGNWGEMILETILEKSGMTKGREYIVQERFCDSAGKWVQPDAIVRFPDNRNVVIDAKVSLNAYQRYCSSDDKAEREAALKEHIKAVKRHIDELSQKQYQDISAITTIDFVLLFMPIEPAYLLAIGNDGELWDYAGEKQILLTSPTNLFAILKMIHGFWRQEYQNRNVFAIADQAGALYDKFVGFIQDLYEVGAKLESAQKSQQAAMQKLCKGKGNLVKRTETIKLLGAKTKKNMPEIFIETDDDEKNGE